MTRDPLHLFQAFGVELEYMLVDADTLDVRPVADRLLRAAATGAPATENPTGGDDEWPGDAEFGDVDWSNELVLHVLEFKTAAPVPTYAGLAARFDAHVRRANELAATLGARLMPTAMHPGMDPFREMRLWPHGYNAVYAAFDRLFDCRGHGWANLQSAHLNLPFAGDDEFGRLHAAIRVLLPILPALAASSPVVERRATGLLDTRLDVYRHNSARIPSIAGQVIPEPIFTEAEYRAGIFERIWNDVAPHDPEGILRDEWLNARGAIARFGRGSIEIRVLDVQECPAADVAICAAVSAVLARLVAESWSTSAMQRAASTDSLAALLWRTVRDAEATPLDDPAYLALFARDTASLHTVGDVWRSLLDEIAAADPASSTVWRAPLGTILDRGPLARRILRRLAGDTSPERLSAVYRELCDCLADGRMFDA